MTRSFELKLSTGEVVMWEGRDGVDTSWQYALAHPGATVVAWRNPNQWGIHAIDRPDRMQIVEPEPGMGGR